MEVSRAVLSMLGCSEYHKRFLHRGSVEQYLYCGKGSYTVEVRRVVLSMLGCIKYHKRFLHHGSLERFLHRGSVEKVSLRETGPKTTQK